jgi:hypothetical protein
MDPEPDLRIVLSFNLFGGQCWNSWPLFDGDPLDDFRLGHYHLLTYRP